LPMSADLEEIAADKDSLAWARTATLAAILVAATLCIAKIVAWLMTGSAAVLGSLADSGLDLFGSVVAAGAVRYASLPADENHRFGHQKVEALTALGQVALIAASATLVSWESVQRLISPEPISQPIIALGVLALSLAMTVGLVIFQTLALKRSGSLIVKGDRAHYIGDVIANGGALIAVAVGVYFAFPRADAIAGLIAAAFLLGAGWQVAKQAIPQLMDEELPDSDQQVLKSLLEGDPDILGFHALRTRRAGERRFIQVDVQINPDMSFREAHEITDRIELAIEKAFPDADVIVHPDPAGEARIERRVLLAAE
ncbi:MAG: cation diffusion facilitator family transporter, partial [Pseudomonadota bacterium]